MQMRLGFSIAVHLQPDVLLLDEVFAVGDVDFQQRCMRTMHDFQDQQKTLLFVSHSDAAVRQMCKRACLLDHGRLQFDGPVDGAFAAYDRLRLARGHTVHPRAAHQPDAPHAAPSTPVADTWYRRALPGDWDAEGARQLAFLRDWRLEPDAYVLDVGCGALRGGRHVVEYLKPGHYYGVDNDVSLVRAAIEVELPSAGLDPTRAHLSVNGGFDFREMPRFDVALAWDLFPSLSLNTITRCVVSVIRQLKPGGCFYVTYWEHDDLSDLHPLIRPSGVATSLDRVPYHYPFELLRRVGEAAGAIVERVEPSADAGGLATVAFRPAGR